MNTENYCIPGRHRLLVQTIKQPLSNSEPQKSWKYKELWGLRPYPSYLQNKCIRSSCYTKRSVLEGLMNK